ncbi:ABC transporter substrate-binding protein [Natrinema sp. 1APR25-10V2]|uniref:ABC transporter substrate-binding protein n=1 Tax=Natrinema sp. 1APR25-10V2 TaxID=2951081 RepID=UPI002874BCA9|nr:ABC transporter substrate-binding protein [Natrinema sp. 1APR25-10V2]MDS0475185.1 ABC transporter substrate-binding protein [Natrinema sp. 1APR25-10V2]
MGKPTSSTVNERLSPLSTLSQDPNRRRFLKSTAGGAASLTLAGCLDTATSLAGGSGDVDPVTIGVLAPNPDSDFIGQSMARAAQVAVDTLNENGGVLGRDVELVVGDTNSSPLEARRQYQRLILEENADVTVGVFASAALENIMGDIAEQQTLHLTSGSATTTPSRLIAEDYDRYKYHFRVGPGNNRDLARTQINFLDDMGTEIGWNSIALLAEDYEWTEGPWEVYQNRLSSTGVDAVMQERYPAAIDDFSSLYNEAEAAGADAVFISTAHTGNAALLDWSYPNRPERPPRPRGFAFGGIHVPMQLPNYYRQTGGACRFGVASTSATAQSEFSGTQEFVSAYQNAYDGDKPVYTGYHTYDAVSLFAQIAEREGTLDSEKLIPALENVSYDGVAGTVEFYGRDHEYPHDLRYVDDEWLYFQWQENDEGGGVQEIIWPEKEATSEYIPPVWL